MIGLAEQLNILFDVIRDPSGKSYSMQDVCKASGIDDGAMSRMRGGHVNNPTLATLRALAGFFGIRIDYFECDTPEKCYAYLAELSMKNQQLADIPSVLRAHGFSDKGVKHILGTISYVREMERRAATRS